MIELEVFFMIQASHEIYSNASRNITVYLMREEIRGIWKYSGSIQSLGSKYDERSMIRATVKINTLLNKSLLTKRIMRMITWIKCIAMLTKRSKAVHKQWWVRLRNLYTQRDNSQIGSWSYEIDMLVRTDLSQISIFLAHYLNLFNRKIVPLKI